jgi:hypothetical protein
VPFLGAGISRGAGLPSGDEKPDDEMGWKLALGMIDLVEESDLLALDRCLIRGAPGTGKTSLLRHLGDLASAEETPIYIPLRSLEAAVGDPAAILCMWAGLGEALRGAAPLGPEVLLTNRFVFLLDGIDEVPRERRARLAELIAEIADALPDAEATGNQAVRGDGVLGGRHDAGLETRFAQGVCQEAFSGGEDPGVLRELRQLDWPGFGGEPMLGWKPHQEDVPLCPIGDSLTSVPFQPKESHRVLRV